MAFSTVNDAGMEHLRGWLADRVDFPITQACLDSFMEEIERNSDDGFLPQCELPGHMNALRPGCPEIFYMPKYGMDRDCESEKKYQAKLKGEI